mgnify:CR=1 FL=1
MSRDGYLLSHVKPHSQPHNKYERNIKQTIEIDMARLKSELDKMVPLSDREYLSLIEDHIMMTALKAAGIEELPIYKSAKSILKDNHIEVHIKPIKPNYK